jgi:hypothetical protein
VVLPTPGGRDFLRRWAAAAPHSGEAGDPWGLAKLQEATNRESHVYCWLPADCAQRRRELGANAKGTALVRVFSQAWLGAHPDPCFLGNPENIKRWPLDSCHYSSEVPKPAQRPLELSRDGASCDCASHNSWPDIWPPSRELLLPVSLLSPGSSLRNLQRS